jgi:hypothetical protein
MTPEESIRFAAALREQQNSYDRLDTLKETLHALETAADPRTLRRARKILLDNAEAFRRSDAPGHSTWYEHHLRAAAFACNCWAQKCQGLAK